MTTIEYLALPKYKRIFYRFIAFFAGIPSAIAGFFTVKIPNFFKKIGITIANVFRNIISFASDGDYKTRTSFLVMGFGLFTRHNYLTGILSFILEIAFIVYAATVGVPSLMKLGTFGYMAQSQYWDPEGDGQALYMVADNSFMILLYSIIFFVLIIFIAYVWYAQLNDSYQLQSLNRIGKTRTDRNTLRGLVGKNYHLLLLSVPTLGLVVFTIIPLVFMILIAFTNYTSNAQSPNELMDWVGLYNFNKLLGVGSGGQQFLYVFGKILLWTLIWAFFATFTNYFLGMIVALLINKKGIKCKKLWRTALITTIAVPQFISLLFMSKFLGKESGGLNAILMSMGLISENIGFLTDANIAKVTIILVNIWIGIPYTMLMCSGLLMNIPQDLYESAKIDGASPFKMYMKITLPYMLFITGPYLISSFVGNINNFNVIYLLSGGGPGFTMINGAPITDPRLGIAGQTDLLITWLYKLVMGEVIKDYALASVVGIVVFIVVASISLILYSRTNAVKNEGDFQ